MARIIKEVIIMLLVCLVSLLLLAVIFYEYIPSRKNVVEIVTYSDTKEISDLLADDIDQQNKNVLLTYQGGEYEVTSGDLNNYKATEKYVPGKANPFEPIKTGDAESTTTTSTSANTTTNSSGNTEKPKENSEKTDNNSEKTEKNESSDYIKDKGTK